ncbi:MAG TPA: hypothetical protein VN733_05070, partial [Solirubrobacterales bacterium]|nr:hypothetical protein [Solirubrobacterales bacterium]
FATWNRLGSTYTHWLQRALSAPGPDKQELRRIVEEARGAFRRAIEVAERTLGHPPVPAPYVDYDLGDERRITYRSWSVLEATIGGHPVKVPGERDNLIRSVYLSLVGASTRHRGRVATAGLLARGLDSLGKVDLAAPFAAFLLVAEGTRSATLKRLSRSVTGAAAEIEGAGDELLARSCLDLVPGVLDGHWHALTIKGDEIGHKQFLRDALQRFSREMHAPLDAEIAAVFSD